jgi:hypothetical protein
MKYLSSTPFTVGPAVKSTACHACVWGGKEKHAEWCELRYDRHGWDRNDENYANIYDVDWIPATWEAYRVDRLVNEKWTDRCSCGHLRSTHGNKCCWNGCECVCFVKVSEEK